MAENQLYITRLVQKELSQKDGDALVAEAKRAVAAEEANLEPDLALLTTADFEALAPTSTQRGQETVRATQAMLLSDTGNPHLTDEQMQALILDGVADMQMAEHLAIQSHRTRLRGYNKIAAATAGGPQSGFSNLWARCSVAPWLVAPPGAPLRVEVMSRRNLVLDLPPLQLVQLLPWMPMIFVPSRNARSYTPLVQTILRCRGCQQSFSRLAPATAITDAFTGNADPRCPASPPPLPTCVRKAPWDCYRVPRVRSPLLQGAGVDGSFQIKTPRTSPVAQWWVNPEAGDASCSVNEPDPHAAAKVIAKVVAASIHPSASKRPSAEKDSALVEKTYPKAEVPKEEDDGALVEKTYPRAEAPKRPREEEEEEEGGATTDSDVVIVEAKTTAPMPKKRKE